MAEMQQQLERRADLVEQSTDEIAVVETMDMGFLYLSMLERLVARGAANLRLYADLVVASEERTWEAKNLRNTVQRMPAGPAVIITPWNAPFLLSTWKLAPGPGRRQQRDPQTGRVVAIVGRPTRRARVEAGFPPGAYNLVQGMGTEVGAALVADPRVRRISFTGSPDTGRAIGRAAAGNLVPFTAELGGKGPLIVFDSRDADTDIAPLAHPDHRAAVHGFVERARAAGDRVVRGGRPVDGSLHYEPTLIEPLSNDSEVVQREVFGPVLTLQTFSDEAEAIALANSTAYGLSAIVWTTSRERAERVRRALRAGLVWVNTFLVRDLTAPFGGCGISGIGREGGDHAIDFHSDLWTLMILDDSVS